VTRKSRPMESAGFAKSVAQSTRTCSGEAHAQHPSIV
jgi:hypothetical protein